ncbi:MAG: alpha-amylase family glycosyl hydrolase [Candidatus Woesearchaeota archaeon]
MSDTKSKITFLYPETSEETYEKLTGILENFKKKHPELRQKQELFSEKDIILITYADHVKEEGKKTFQTMGNFLSRYAKDINTVHFLPFSPYSSDDGFSVIDYYQVNPEFGSWDDVQNISKNFNLMFDLVINHVSSKSEWFQEFLKGNEKYQDYFIYYETKPDTAEVFRPRTHPLLTQFNTSEGKRYVWTTFSEDQIDLNFRNPEVMLEMIKVLLFYIEKGARIIRLDAIAYLWKELGTSCIHLPQTHEFVRLLRDVVDEVAPSVRILTETNVPHKDNISYFGDGNDEAHMVYNFSLPPILIYSFIKQDSKILSEWARELEEPSKETAFFNFTASHDGIGLTPLKNIVPDEEIEQIALYADKKGGKVNYRIVSGNEKKPYELNIVYLDAFDNPKAFLCSQAISLALKGVPGIYFNSLIGAQNWTEGVEKLKYNRAINRKKFNISELDSELQDQSSLKNKVYNIYKKILDARINERLFDPKIDQVILDLGKNIFGLVRFHNNESIVCLFNLSSEEASVAGKMIKEAIKKDSSTDIITENNFNLLEDIVLNPYEFVWLK